MRSCYLSLFFISLYCTFKKKLENITNVSHRSKKQNIFSWLNWDYPKAVRNTPFLYPKGIQKSLIIGPNKLKSQLRIFVQCPKFLNYWHLDWKILYCEECPMHCRMFSGFSGFYLLDASGTPGPQYTHTRAQFMTI